MFKCLHIKNMQPFKKCTPLGRPLLGPQGTPFWPFRVKVRRRSCTSSFAFSSSRTSASCRRRSTARALLSSASCGRPGPSPAAAMSVSFPAPGRGWLWGAAIRLHTFLNGRRPGKQPWGECRTPDSPTVRLRDPSYNPPNNNTTKGGGFWTRGDHHGQAVEEDRKKFHAENTTAS